MKICKDCKWWEVRCDEKIGKACEKYTGEANKHIDCESCEDPHEGYCHFFPPTRTRTDNEDYDDPIYWIHSQTVEDDWCGKFEINHSSVEANKESETLETLRFWGNRKNDTAVLQVAEKLEEWFKDAGSKKR